MKKENIFKKFKKNFPKFNLIFLGWFLLVIIITIIFAIFIKINLQNYVDLETKNLPIIQNLAQSDPAKVGNLAQEILHSLNLIGLMVYLYLFTLIILGILRNKIIYTKLKEKISFEKILLNIFSNFFFTCIMIFLIYKSIHFFSNTKVIFSSIILGTTLIFFVNTHLTLFIFDYNKKNKIKIKNTLKKLCINFIVYLLSIISTILAVAITSYLLSLVSKFNLTISAILILVFMMIIYISVKELYYLKIIEAK